MNAEFVIDPELMRKALGASMRNPELQRIFKEAPQEDKPVLKLKFAAIVFPDQISDEAFGANLEELAKTLGADDLRYLIDNETDAGLKAYFESLLHGGMPDENLIRNMSVVCPHCHAECGVAENDYGRFIKCEECGKGFIVGQAQRPRLRSGLHSDRNSIGLRSFVRRYFHDHLPRAKRIRDRGLNFIRRRPFAAVLSFAGLFIAGALLFCMTGEDKLAFKYPAIPEGIPSWQRNGLNLYNAIVTNSVFLLKDEEILEGLLGVNSAFGDGKVGVKLSNSLVYRSYVVVEQKIQCSEAAFLKYYDDDVLKLNDFMKGKGFQIKIKEGGNIEIEIAKLDGNESGVIRESMKEGFIYPKGIGESLAMFVWTQCSWLSNIKKYFLHSELCLSNGEAKRRLRETLGYAEEKFSLLKLDADSCLYLPLKKIKVQKTRVCGKWDEIKQDLKDENWMDLISKMKWAKSDWKTTRPQRRDVVSAYMKILSTYWTVELTYRDLPSEHQRRFKVYEWDARWGFVNREKKDRIAREGASENHLTFSFRLRNSPCVLAPDGDDELQNQIKSISCDYRVAVNKTKVLQALGFMSNDQVAAELKIAKRNAVAAVGVLMGCRDRKSTLEFPLLSHNEESFKWERNESQSKEYTWQHECSAMEIQINESTVATAKQNLADVTSKIPRYEEASFPEFENDWRHGECRLCYNDDLGGDCEWTCVTVRRNENAKLDIKATRAEHKISRNLKYELARKILLNRIAIDECGNKNQLPGKDGCIHLDCKSGSTYRLGESILYWNTEGDYQYFAMKKSVLSQEFGGKWDQAIRTVLDEGREVYDVDEFPVVTVNPVDLRYRKWPYQWQYECEKDSSETLSLCVLFVKAE